MESNPVITVPSGCTNQATMPMAQHQSDPSFSSEIAAVLRMPANHLSKAEKNFMRTAQTGLPCGIDGDLHLFQMREAIQ